MLRNAEGYLNKNNRLSSMGETKAWKVSEMKTAVVLALVLLMCHGSLQDAGTPDPKADLTVEVILLRDKFTELNMEMRFMQKYNEGKRTPL